MSNCGCIMGVLLWMDKSGRVNLLWMYTSGCLIVDVYSGCGTVDV